jgi:hypothetical protein
MTNEDFPPDDVHEQIIKKFIEYSKYNARFKLFGYKESAKLARAALSEIRVLAKTRRAEIQARKNELHGIDSSDDADENQN